MKLYRFLDVGETIIENDQFWSPSAGRWVPSSLGIGATVGGGGLPYRRLVAEVPDDANIPAALIAAEIVEELIADGNYDAWVERRCGEYLAVKGGAR